MMLDDSPEARRAYLENGLSVLCEEVGIRDAGSEADARAAEFIAGELSSTCDQLLRQPLRFDRWVLTSPAALRIDGRSIECYPFYGSVDTTEAGVSGSAASLPAGEPLTEEAGIFGPDGRRRALLLPGPFGPAVPRYDPAVTGRGIPAVGIGRDEWGRLAGAPERQHRADLVFRSELRRDSTTENLVGTLLGQEEDEILIIAHRDTQYNSPGANDNTASLLTMLLLADYFSRRRPRLTLRFFASAAEEIGCLGAKKYAAARRAEGSMGKIRLSLNFDSLTYGRNAQIYTPSPQFGELLARAFRESVSGSEPEVFPELDSLDGAPFAAAGVPAIYLNSRGDSGKLRLWHRPGDIPETVDHQLVEGSFRSIVRFIEAMNGGAA